jgi:hypothetical protein
VISRQPLAQARRQKQLLVSVTQKEVRRHRSLPSERANLGEDPSARHNVNADADPVRLVPRRPRAQS